MSPKPYELIYPDCASWADGSRSVRRLSRYGGVLNIVALCRLPTPTHDTVVGTENSTTSFSRTTLGHRVLRTQNKLIDGMMHANLLFLIRAMFRKIFCRSTSFSLNPDSDVSDNFTCTTLFLQLIPITLITCNSLALGLPKLRKQPPWVVW